MRKTANNFILLLLFLFISSQSYAMQPDMFSDDSSDEFNFAGRLTMGIGHQQHETHKQEEWPKKTVKRKLDYNEEEAEPLKLPIDIELSINDAKSMARSIMSAINVFFESELNPKLFDHTMSTKSLEQNFTFLCQNFNAILFRHFEWKKFPQKIVINTDKALVSFYFALLPVIIDDLINISRKIVEDEPNDLDIWFDFCEPLIFGKLPHHRPSQIYQSISSRLLEMEDKFHVWGSMPILENELLIKILFFDHVLELGLALNNYEFPIESLKQHSDPLTKHKKRVKRNLRNFIGARKFVKGMDFILHITRDLMLPECRRGYGSLRIIQMKQSPSLESPASKNITAPVRQRPLKKEPSEKQIRFLKSLR